MPMGNDMGNGLKAPKFLVLGDPKAGKTDYIFRAAEAGWNILFLDGDVGIQCLQAMIRSGRISSEAAGRIAVLNISDYLSPNGTLVPFMAQFFVKFTTQGRFMWNDTLQRPFELQTYKPDEGHEIWEIRPGNMGADVILGGDSWTTLSSSVVQWKADDLGEDILDIEKVSRDMYAGTGHKLTQFLTLLRALPCPVAFTGHPREYVKLEKPKGRIGNMQEKDMKIEWTKMIPQSSSNPHGYTLAKNFSDVAWIEVDAMGRRKVDFRPTDSRSSGGHLNKIGDTDELSLSKALEYLGFATPDGKQGMDSWLTRWPNGTYEPAASRIAKPLGIQNKIPTADKIGEAPPLEPAKATPLRGLGGLGGLKPSGVQKG